MKAAFSGKLDCLEYLIAKGAKLEAEDKVSAAPPAAPKSPAPLGLSHFMAFASSPFECSALAARRPCCPIRRPRCLAPHHRR